MDNNNMNNEQNNFYQDNTADVNVQTPVNNTVETPKKADTLAIVALVCGILSIVLSCCTAYIGIIPGIVGIVCSILSKKNNGKTGVATAGMICSIIGIVIGIVWTIVIILLSAAGMAMLDASMYF